MSGIDPLFTSFQKWQMQVFYCLYFGNQLRIQISHTNTYKPILICSNGGQHTGCKKVPHRFIHFCLDYTRKLKTWTFIMNLKNYSKFNSISGRFGPEGTSHLGVRKHPSIKAWVELYIKVKLFKSIDSNKFDLTSKGFASTNASQNTFSNFKYNKGN